jgi:hypothetical protein
MSKPGDDFIPQWITPDDSNLPVPLVPVDEPTEDEMEADDAAADAEFEALRVELEDLKDPDTLLVIPTVGQLIPMLTELAGDNDDDPT